GGPYRMGGSSNRLRIGIHPYPSSTASQTQCRRRDEPSRACIRDGCPSSWVRLGLDRLVQPCPNEDHSVLFPRGAGPMLSNRPLDEIFETVHESLCLGEDHLGIRTAHGEVIGIVTDLLQVGGTLERVSGSFRQWTLFDEAADEGRANALLRRQGLRFLQEGSLCGEEHRKVGARCRGVEILQFKQHGGASKKLLRLLEQCVDPFVHDGSVCFYWNYER